MSGCLPLLCLVLTDMMLQVCQHLLPVDLLHPRHGRVRHQEHGGRPGQGPGSRSGDSLLQNAKEVELNVVPDQKIYFFTLLRGGSSEMKSFLASLPVARLGGRLLVISRSNIVETFIQAVCFKYFTTVPRDQSYCGRCLNSNC